MDVGLGAAVTTENGAPSLATTKDPRLDLFFKLVRDVLPHPTRELRKFDPQGFFPGKHGFKDDDPDRHPSGVSSDSSDHLTPVDSNQRVDLIPRFGYVRLFGLIDDSWKRDPLDTMKILFNGRDCRGGKGDYWPFLQCMRYISRIHVDWFAANFKLIPEYGRYQDLVILWHLLGHSDRLHDRSWSPTLAQARSMIMDFLVETLKVDMASLTTGPGDVSLLPKWLPTEKGRWDRPYSPTLYEPIPCDYNESFCEAIASRLFDVNGAVTSMHLMRYRKEYLAPLRKHLSLVESYLTQKECGAINYEKVPSVAMTKYRAAFDRNDTDRFAEFIDRVKTGDARINANQLYPHDLIRPYMREDPDIDPVLEEQWKVLKSQVAASGAFDDSLIICDVSGSMEGTPMEVAIALGLLGMNNRRLITFSEDPKLHEVPDGSLMAQVQNVMKMEWGGSTNIEKVFDLVLDGESASASVKRLFIFSDMQFNKCIYQDNFEAVHFDILRKRFETRERVMPQIVFWNLRGCTRDFPVKSDQEGVIMLSGFSPSLLNAILGNEYPTPMGMLLTTIHAPRYDKIVAPSGFTAPDGFPQSAPVVEPSLDESSPVGRQPGCFSCMR